MEPNKLNLIWIDLEMTGLDTINDEILEAAIVITDSQLNILAESKDYVLYQSDEVLSGMDNWNQNQHSSSGLIDAVKKSKYDCAQVESELLEFVAKYAIKGASPMCGNSICQDRRFLFRLMPRLESFFHYRNLDVSTIKELSKRWNIHYQNMDGKEVRHRALEDVHDSIKELKLYRDTLFSV